MGEASPGTSTTARPPGDRLDSWKEIAAYLNRDVTTVQRWEKREGMPVHRQDVYKRQDPGCLIAGTKIQHATGHGDVADMMESQAHHRSRRGCTFGDRPKI